MAALNGFLHYFPFLAALNHPGKKAFGAVKGLIASQIGMNASVMLSKNRMKGERGVDYFYWPEGSD